MADVKNLFLGGLRLRTGCLLAVMVLLVILGAGKADLKKFLPGCYFRAFGVFLGVAVFLAIAFAVDFTRCFTIFHEIFFTNDLWIFDPATDYMIRMLPEGFFADMVAQDRGDLPGDAGSPFPFVLLPAADVREEKRGKSVRSVVRTKIRML